MYLVLNTPILNTCLLKSSCLHDIAINKKHVYKHSVSLTLHVNITKLIGVTFDVWFSLIILRLPINACGKASNIYIANML